MKFEVQKLCKENREFREENKQLREKINNFIKHIRS